MNDLPFDAKMKFSTLETGYLRRILERLAKLRGYLDETSLSEASPVTDIILRQRTNSYSLPIEGPLTYLNAVTLGRFLTCDSYGLIRVRCKPRCAQPRAGTPDFTQRAVLMLTVQIPEWRLLFADLVQ
jgi:hypothetical protein